ncbi:MAG TPA: histidine kinase dimerization/phosphoacceptor domain-containing protein, partial [Thermoleophilaceae bacterium]|nr:histidine kinase dimerization/phosphoacceptor domain-containing protein [Thermoleophilaceae bacterium]
MLLFAGRKASRARLALASLVTPGRLTRVLCLLAVAVVGAAGVSVIVAGQFADRAEVGVATCIALMTTVLAVLVSRRRPTNVVGPLLAWMALQAGLDAFSTTYPPTRARRPDVLPDLPDIASAALATTWVWLYAAVALLMLFFPDGRLPGRRWRWVALGLPAVAVMVQVVMAVSPGPYDAPYAAVRHPFGDLPEDLVLGLKVVLFPLLVGLMLACALSLRVRFRRADEEGRRQLKWLALAALAVPGTVILSWGGFLLLGTHDLAGVGLAVLYTAVPAATAIAILRHNLYDVDRALSTGVTYTAVTVALLAVFTTVSFAGGVLLGRDSAAAAAGATALTALAIAPTRRRLQRVVDRRLYPLRQAALDAIERLGRSVAVGEARPEQLQAVLRVALKDPALRVGVLVPGGHGLLDPAGEPLSLDATATPVTVHGQEIGAIASGGAVPAQLLREIANASAMLVEMVRLRLELSAALREVESSRTRLQRIGDEERRRLERDLHDGAQQRLVSLGMALRLAQRQLGDGAVDLD